MRRYEPQPLVGVVPEFQQGDTFPNGQPVEPWGILDTVDNCWVDHWGESDPWYWAACRDIAESRAGDLNESDQVKVRGR